MRVRRAALCCGLLLLCAPARSSEVVAVLSSDSPHYRQAFEGFQEAWGSPVPHVLLGRPVPQARAIVAFGSRAALHPWPDDAHVEVCLAPAAPAPRPGGHLVVDLLPDPDLMLKRIHTVLPGVKTLRVLWTSANQKDLVAAIVAAAAARQVAVLSDRVPSVDALPEALRGGKRADAIFLMPDPALVNATTFEVIKEYSKAARIPFLAPTDGLAEKGATATFAVPFRDIGRAAAQALKAHLAGLIARERAHSDVVRVTVSASAAADVGLDVKELRGVDRIVP